MEIAKSKNMIEYVWVAIISLTVGYLASVYGYLLLVLVGLIVFGVFVFLYFDFALIALVFYIPFQVALNVSSGIDLASGRVLILFLFFVWLVKSVREKKLNINFSLQTIFLPLFLFLAAFSTLWAFEDERAMRKILVFLSIFPLYFLVSANGSKRYVYRILDALFAGGLLISVIGLAQFAAQFVLGIDPVMKFWSETVAPVFYGNEFGFEVVSNPSWLVNVNGETILRVFSVFPDPHMFSFYAGLILPILVSFGLYYDKSFKNNGSFFLGNSFIITMLILIITVSEALTFSRGGYVGMVFGLGALIVFGWRYLDSKKKFVLGVFFSVFILFAATNGQQFVLRFISSFDLSEGSNSERLVNWQQGYEMFSDNILAGVGIGNYSYELKPSAGYRTPIYAHNTYLDIGAEMGIFTLIVWLILFFSSVVVLYKHSSIASDRMERALSLGLIGSLVWFLAHSFFDTAIYSPIVLSVLMVILALVAIISAKKLSF